MTKRRKCNFFFFFATKPLSLQLLNISLSSETLTAAVYDCRAGWQGDLLELWGNYGNRRLVYPRLCEAENKNLTRLVTCAPAVCVCSSARSQRPLWQKSLR